MVEACHVPIELKASPVEEKVASSTPVMRAPTDGPLGIQRAVSSVRCGAVRACGA